MGNGRKLTIDIQLRDVTETDLPIFFKQQQDPDANYMAAFTAKDPTDRDAFNSHSRKILADPTVTMKTILAKGQVVGSIAKYERDGKPEVTYWIGKEHWGKGIATKALTEFLTQVKIRPIYAGAAKDNLASLRVLEKCGFIITGYGKGFANARGKEIEEAILIRPAP